MPRPPLTPFDPYLENQSFFGHAVFSKWCGTLRSFFYHHINKIVRVVCSQKSKNIKFGPFGAHLPQKRGIRCFFGKSGSVTFFHLYSPNFMQEIRKILRAISEKRDGQTSIHRTPAVQRTGVQLVYIIHLI